MPPGGDMFGRARLPIIARASLPTTTGLRWCRFWDAAGTEGAGDYTAGVLVAYHAATKIAYIGHVIQGQWSSAAVNALILHTAQVDRRHATVREERTPGSAGLAVINARNKDIDYV